MSESAASQLAAMSYAQSIAALIAVMVVVAVVTAALEVHTPASRRRSTRFTLPRRVEGEVETLPRMESVRSEYDRHLADVLTPKPSVLLRPGPNGPQPVTPPGVGGLDAMAAAALYEQRLENGPPTEEVPIVFGPAWATTESVEPPARVAIRRAVSARMVAPLPWDGAELRVRVPRFVTGPGERYVEDEIAAAVERLESPATVDASAPLDPIAGGTAEPESVGHDRGAPTSEPVLARAAHADGPGGSTTVFAVRPELPDAETVELGDPGRDRELAGVLFAAYVATGGEERNRVTGWVTACATAPSLPGIEPQERLRGRPGKVARLLACTDDDRNWVTLDERTDIRRGLTAKAPTDPVLKGVLWWWFMATDDNARVPAEHVSVLREGLEQVAPAVEGHPFAPTLDRVIKACADAEDAHVGIRLESVCVSTPAQPERRTGGSRVATGAEAAGTEDPPASESDLAAGEAVAMAV